MPYHTIRDFEWQTTACQGPNYGWFQCQLDVAARRLVDVSGPGVVRRLWDAFRIEDRELARRLGDDVHPDLGVIAEELDREHASR